MRKLRLLILICSGLCGAQTPAGAQSDSAFRYRWNGYGYYGGGSSVVEGGQGGFKGGGAGTSAMLASTWATTSPAVRKRAASIRFFCSGWEASSRMNQRPLFMAAGALPTGLDSTSVSVLSFGSMNG